MRKQQENGPVYDWLGAMPPTQGFILRIGGGEQQQVYIRGQRQMEGRVVSNCVEQMEIKVVFRWLMGEIDERRGVRKAEKVGFIGRSESR